MPTINRETTSLIIGAYGFVGMHLARNLLRRGDAVIMFGHKPTEHMSELTRLRREYGDRLEIIYGEVIPDLHDRFAEDPTYNVRDVYHLAAKKVHSGMPIRDMQSVLSYNYDIDTEVFSVCEMLNHYRPVRLLYMSSGEVLGLAFLNNKPLREDSATVLFPEEPKHMYPASKLMGEMTLRHEGWSFPWAIARLQNPYGPRMGSGLFIPRVMKMVVEGVPIFKADADNSRPYIYIDDACMAFMNILDNPYGAHQTFNVCAERSYLNSDVVRAISEVTKSVVLLDPTASIDSVGATNRQLTVEKLVSMLGWRETISLEEGLRRTWDYYRPTFMAQRAMDKIQI